jgi:hypothetical protein
VSGNRAATGVVAESTDTKRRINRTAMSGRHG